MKITSHLCLVGFGGGRGERGAHVACHVSVSARFPAYLDRHYTYHWLESSITHMPM
jgi:hypothetical protein